MHFAVQQGSVVNQADALLLGSGYGAGVQCLTDCTTCVPADVCFYPPLLVSDLSHPVE